MGGWFNIQYMKEPSLTKKSGLGMGAAAIGDSLMKLGQIGIDKQRVDDDKVNKERDYQLNVDRMKADKEYRENSLAVDRDRNNALAKYHDDLVQEKREVREQKAREDAANIGLFRKRFADQTKGLSDEEVLAFGRNMDKFAKQGKSVNLNKVAVFTDGNGDKIGIFEAGGQIIKQNFGKAESKNKGGLGDDWVEVDADTYREHADTGQAKNTKDGFYVKKSVLQNLNKRRDGYNEEM